MIVFNRKGIERVIPHRGQSQFLDRVEIDEEKGEATGYFTPKIWMCEGHFPGNPVVPGHFLQEAFNLTVAVLGMYKFEPGGLVLLRESGNFKMKRQVSPGEKVVISAKITKNQGATVYAGGQVWVGDTLVMETTEDVRGAFQGKVKEE